MGGIHAREECAVLCMRSCLMRCAGNDGISAVVDIFNVTAGTWRTAKLSLAATFLSATSLPNAGLAIFAGGRGTCLLRLFELLRDALLCEGGCASGRRVLCLS